MSDGNILYAIRDDACFIRLEGEIRYTESVPFDHFIDELFDRERPEQILIDLNGTTLIDSTNLGLLAKIAKRLMNLRNRAPTVFSTSEDINMLLENIGFDEVFDIVGGEQPGPAAMQEVKGDAAGAREQARIMIDAHRQLMALNERNRDVFRNVVEMLEKDIDESGS